MTQKANETSQETLIQQLAHLRRALALEQAARRLAEESARRAWRLSAWRGHPRDGSQIPAE
jgi:hypothetical protein